MIDFTPMFCMMAERDMKMKDMAAILGVTGETLSNIRHNRTNTTVEIIDKACKYFHCGINDIIKFIPD